jgi:hypothetical protein
LLKRESVAQAGGVGLPGVRACEDWDLYARMAKLKMRFICEKRVLASYYQHREALSRNVELMLNEKINLLERLIPRDSITNKMDDEINYGAYRNGAVYFSLGQSVGETHDLAYINNILQKTVNSEFRFRYFCNQFLFGLRNAYSLRRPVFEDSYIEKICECVSHRLDLHGNEHYACMFMAEMAREMREPLKRFPIARRFSRMLDSTRPYWI